MKELSIACCLLLAAGVLSAAEAKKPETKKAEPAPTAAASAPAPAPIVTAPPSATDSPLVAAAKKSKRGKAKPGNVITNDTLSKSGGHITQAEKLPELPAPLPPPKPKPVDPMAAEYARRAEAVKKQEAEKKAKEIAAKKKSDAERATAATYDDTLDERFDDPAAAEHAMQQNPANQPPATTTQKPPM
ncbi:MAG: hypothetical protein QOI24_694 [Acidobacteriota bacterium]|jgi:hypothetical protein|nr:hypothetical protein [Acidobacteriota bacterium]